MSKKTQGKRVYEKAPHELEPGEYSFSKDGYWCCCTPDGRLGMLSKHKVEEHEDGTITVTPSILVRSRDGENGWHGFLRLGVWEEC